MTPYILIDWGTSNFRAYLADAAGNVLERRQSAKGIMAVEDGRFEQAAMEEIGAWIETHGRQKVLMAGMIGSRQGWVEAPYVECPAGAADLARRMVAADAKGRFLVAPGMCRRSASNHFDVMRGEETQIVGAIGLAQREGRAGDGLYCLPGTHSKWVRVEAGEIVDFSTAMTGELFAILSAHSILGRLMRAEDPEDWRAFDAGQDRAEEDGGLLSHLFSARADVLLGGVGERSAKSYLSGILIGHELRGQASQAPKDAAVSLVGAPGLIERYRRALGRIGRPTQTIAAEAATIHGLIHLAKARADMEGGAT